MRWRSNGAWAAPVVMRVPIGGYLTGGSIYHSAVRRKHLHPLPRPPRRLPVQRPRTPTACCAPPSAATTPCSSSRHKRLYRETYGRAPYPGPRLHHPLRQGQRRAPRQRPHPRHLRRHRPARLQAAEKAARDHGIDVEILDLRTLNPYDWEAIATSVRKTSVSSSPTRTCSVGAMAQSWPPASLTSSSISSTPRPSHRLHGHLRRLPAHPRRRHPAPTRNHSQSHQRPPRLVTGRAGRRSL